MLTTNTDSLAAAKSIPAMCVKQTMVINEITDVSQRCHDENESHPNEHANRMICGYCSREQNYRPDDCHFCRSSLIARVGHGFWEGGKGKAILLTIIHHHIPDPRNSHFHLLPIIDAAKSVAVCLPR
jgi:hypothetical protein